MTIKPSKRDKWLNQAKFLPLPGTGKVVQFLKRRSTNDTMFYIDPDTKERIACYVCPCCVTSFEKCECCPGCQNGYAYSPEDRLEQAI